MKHKLLTVLLTLIATLCLCFGLVGCDGKDGKDGIGIQSVEVDENGDLKVTLDDGTVLNAGKVTADGSAAEGTEGLQYQKIKGEDGEYNLAVVGLGTAWDTDIVIPSTYRGLKVTTIGNNAFNASMDARSANLTSITIPDSVTSIGNDAFSGCSGLTGELKIPDRVTSIGEDAFGGCSSLESINIPDGVTSIGNYTFDGCSSLESINIPDGVTSIGEYAFRNCSSLESINIPDGVTSIGDRAFYGCSSLESVTIGDSVTSIGEDAFRDCSSLRNIEIPDGVTSIGDRAFYGCSGLTSVTIGSGVTSIGYRAFDDCGSLKNVYYMGTADEWDRISIDYDNFDLISATRYYYSAEENYDGEHWHYDPVTNQPAVWTKENA